MDFDRLLTPAARALAPPTALSPLRYDLNAGVPDRATLPAPELAEAVAHVLREAPAEALTYGGAQGFEPLRAWIAARQAAETGLPLTAEHVTLCSGSAHAIDNIAATFLAPGDIVAMPAPSYPGAIRAFRARGAEIVSVPQDVDGMRPDDLERVLAGQRAAGRPAKLIYVIANYDNPSGSTLPPERREALVRLAREHRALLVEDDAYTGIDLDGPPPGSLYAIAGGAGILRVGTFSKTVATGLRVGWVVAEPAIIRALVFMRFDNGGSPLLQRAVHAYLERNDFDAHLDVLRGVYRERRDAAVAALREHCAPLAEFHVPAGGFLLWLRLSEGLDAARAVEAAARHDVAITPGPNYFPAREGGERNVRLVYSALPPAELRDAIERLGQALREANDGP